MSLQDASHSLITWYVPPDTFSRMLADRKVFSTPRDSSSLRERAVREAASAALDALNLSSQESRAKVSSALVCSAVFNQGSCIYGFNLLIYLTEITRTSNRFWWTWRGCQSY